MAFIEMVRSHARRFAGFVGDVRPPPGALGGVLVVTSLASAMALGGMRAWSWSTPPRCADMGCPALDGLGGYRLPEPPHMYDRDGNLVAHLPGPVRLWASLEEISPWIVEGVVAVEDRRFFDHGGVDFRGVVRAAARNLAGGGVREGASTITMQLARNLWAEGLRDHDRWRRKATEVRLAAEIERQLPKPRILELYLNRVYLGQGIYGVGTAALHYFGKPVGDLTLGEAAILVGTVRTPERYNPRAEPDEARRRRDVVLAVMEGEGVISEAEAAAARREPLRPVEKAPVRQASSYYAAAVDRELRRLFPDPDQRTGLRVYTAFDPETQEAAEKRLLEQIARIESGAEGRFAHAVPTARDDEATDGPEDVLQGAVVVLDLGSGAVRAVVGGRSFEASEFDRALQGRRQPGSAFKPFVYGAALEAGTVTLADRVDLSPVVLDTEEGPWSPRDEVSDEGSLPVRQALVRSSNRAAVRVGIEAGIDNVVHISRRLGIRSPVAPYPASLLGASEVTPVELAAAYAAFGNGGLRVTPHLITRVEDRSGRVVYAHRNRVERALDPGVAFLVRSALQDVVDQGTGRGVRRAGYGGPAAGKTGTTNAGRDAWFVGFNDRVVTAVWLGFDRPRSIVPDASGGRLAAPVWGGLMADLFGADEGEAGDWGDPPAGVVRVAVDQQTGTAFRKGCPAAGRVRDELFLAGTEPPSLCERLQIRIAGGDAVRGMLTARVADLVEPTRRGSGEGRD